MLSGLHVFLNIRTCEHVLVCMRTRVNMVHVAPVYAHRGESAVSGVAPQALTTLFGVTSLIGPGLIN